MNSEPVHFLKFANAFPSLGGIHLPVSWPASVSTKVLASQRVLDFVRPSETQKITLVAPGIKWSLKLKKKPEV